MSSLVMKQNESWTHEHFKMSYLIWLWWHNVTINLCLFFGCFFGVFFVLFIFFFLSFVSFTWHCPTNVLRTLILVYLSLYKLFWQTTEHLRKRNTCDISNNVILYLTLFVYLQSMNLHGWSCVWKLSTKLLFTICNVSIKQQLFWHLHILIGAV